jgi:hypothetical protein
VTTLSLALLLEQSVVVHCLEGLDARILRLLIKLDGHKDFHVVQATEA